MLEMHKDRRMHGKSEREEAAYLAGRQDAQVLCNMYFAGTNNRPPDLMQGRECAARDMALWIERHGMEHDRLEPLPSNCIAVYRGGNITCLQPFNANSQGGVINCPTAFLP